MRKLDPREQILNLSHRPLATLGQLNLVRPLKEFRERLIIGASMTHPTLPTFRERFIGAQKCQHRKVKGDVLSGEEAKEDNAAFQGEFDKWELWLSITSK